MIIEAEATTPSAILDRASLLLDAFDGPGRLNLAQIVRRTGLPRSSAHRMLERLVQLRWLRREGRDYQLGIRLVELGSLAVHQDRLHRAAKPFLHELHRVTGLVVHLAVLDGPDVVFLDKIGGDLSTAIPSRVGGRRPAHCTAAGKAILASADPRRLDDIVTGPANAQTRYSITSRAQLNAQLEKVRTHGIAVEREESTPGVGCLAAPIGDLGEAAVAAVSVCGPVDRMQFDHRLAAPVRTTALNIWRQVDDGRVRVHPTLQHARPLGHGPATRPQPDSRTPRYAS
ncbi:IclR family transcriptional regulator [Nocardia stercoris]|uniref:IclR family transcriptional regulator n=1 Tax=Nocardia stercoris TaxID=2483361 RepID=A0A3M2KSE0_9NOCA|nr:IclR family transcriptional regulator [Nocardia stercoris]RMI27991.1 IclR family transcriptional regulator [Nocardia stercoris]